MNRRRLLRAAGATTVAGLAGCIGGLPGSRDDTPTEGSGGLPSSFTVTATRCGNQASHADVTHADGTVTVEGTLWGNDACYTGRLESVELEGGTLTVSVVTESEADEDQGCAQCITEIDYRATIEVSPPPDQVVVRHGGETVATATPSKT